MIKRSSFVKVVYKGQVVKVNVNSEKQRCTKCHKNQFLIEFYLRDKTSGKRQSTCRTCSLKNSGVLSLGLRRVHIHLLEYKKRRCRVCKLIKNLETDFYKLSKNKTGFGIICIPCELEKARKTHAKRVRARPEKVKTIKYTFEGQVFYTRKALAEYVEEKYKILKDTFLHRIIKGHSLEDSILSTSLFQSKFSGRKRKQIN